MTHEILTGVAILGWGVAVACFLLLLMAVSDYGEASRKCAELHAYAEEVKAIADRLASEKADMEAANARLRDRLVAAREALKEVG